MASPVDIEAAPLTGSSPTSTVGKASVPSSILNLTNTVLGAGVLSLPLFFKEVGVVLGIALVFAAGVVAIYGLKLLGKCGQREDIEVPSYAAMANRTIPKLTKIIDVGVISLTFGVCCAYLMIIGDLMPLAYSHFATAADGFFAARGFWIIAAMFVVIPISLLPSMDSLKVVSSLSLMAIIGLCLIVISFAFSYGFGVTIPEGYYAKPGVFLNGCGGETPQLGLLKIFHIGSNIINVLPMVIFAYTCHPNIFIIVEELNNPTTERLNKVVTTSVLISGAVYTTVGVFGYLTFYDQTCDNILKNYDDTSLIVSIARIATCIVSLFSYPMVLYPCRTCVDTMIFGEGKRGYIIQVMQTLVICIATLVVALSLKSLGTLFSLMGSIGSSLTAFILPGVYSYYLLGPGKAPPSPTAEGRKDRTWSSMLTRGDVLLFLWGCVVMVAAPYTVISAALK